MGKIKIRFNLRRGLNYMKWKVTYPDGNIEYYNPTEVQLILKNTQLKNHKGVAKKIFEGGNKVVCAWVLCEEIEIITENFNQTYKVDEFDITHVFNLIGYLRVVLLMI